MTAAASPDVTITTRIIAFGLFALSMLKRLDVSLILLGLFILFTFGMMSSFNGLLNTQNKNTMTSIANSVSAEQANVPNTFLEQSDTTIMKEIDTHLSLFGDESGGTDEIFALMSAEDEVITNDTDIQKMEPLAGTGRPDPFAPLIMTAPDGSISFGELEVESNPFSAIQVIGLIENPNSADSVAILQVNDPIEGSSSLVKRAGDTFMLKDSTVKIKQIKSNGVLVVMNGQQEFVPLNEFVDNITTKSAENDAEKLSGLEELEEVAQ